MRGGMWYKNSDEYPSLPNNLNVPWLPLYHQNSSGASAQSGINGSSQSDGKSSDLGHLMTSVFQEQETILLVVNT